MTPQQLEVLLNNLLQQGEPLPYAFFLQDHELAGELGSHLKKQQVILPPTPCPRPAQITSKQLQLSMTRACFCASHVTAVEVQWLHLTVTLSRNLKQCLLVQQPDELSLDARELEPRVPAVL